MNRRDFLKALLGLGAAVALPTQLTEAQVDEAWDQLVRRPFVFEVDDTGTVVEPGGTDPKVNRDVYGDHVEPARITTVKALISTVRSHAELTSVFVELASNARYDALDLIDRDDSARRDECDDERATPAERADAERVIDLIRDPDRDWPAWVRADGAAALPNHLARIEAWLAEPVNWQATEWWPRDWHGQGKALRFFEMLDRDTRDALGIVVVEGEHPGSDYYAAELRKPIDDTNRIAVVLKLPFRFTAS